MEPIERFIAALAALTGATVATPLAPELRAALDAPLPRDKVKSRSQAGETFAYVDGYYVIERLNEVFGHLWSFRHTPPAEVMRYERETRNGKNLVVIFQVHGRLEAAGTFREDVGVGVCDMRTDNPASGLEKALKEAVTDCLKRCSKGFGPSFGLALYDKNRAAVGLSTTANGLLAELDTMATAEAVTAWVNGVAPMVAKLDEDERAILKGAAAARRRELAAAQAPEQPPPAGATATAPQGSPAPASASAPPANSNAAPAPLAAYRNRVAAAATPDVLVAAVLELAPSVSAHRDEAWRAACARAVELGWTPEGLASGVGAAKAITPEPSAWRAAGGYLAALAAAPDRAAVDAATKAHGAGVAALPDGLRAKMREALAAARGRTAPEASPAKRLEAAIRSARTIPDVDAAAEAAEAAHKAGQITTDELRALAVLQDEVATAMERGAAA